MSEQPLDRLTKAELLSGIHSEYALLEETLAGLSESQMVQPGVEGGWSVKDIIAHIAVWQQRMVGWVTEALQGEIPKTEESVEQMHQWNQESYLANQDKLLDEVLADFRHWHQEALTLTEATSEEELCDPNRYVWLKGRPLWAMIVGDTRDHYQEHRQNVAAWLENQRSSV